MALDLPPFPVEEVAGLPLHPLVVHGAVVLIPLTAVGLILMASSGTRSKRYSPLIVAVAVAATISAFLARMTGETMRLNVGIAGSSDHFRYGELLPWGALALLILVVLLALMDRQGGGHRNAVGTIVALVAIVGAVAVSAATVLVGHSGAELVWG